MNENQIPYNKRTVEEFIELSNSIHDNKYDYSKVNYINNKTKITIICKEHGEFEQKPEHHLRGSGCPACKNCMRLNTNTFIKKSEKIHNNKYNYSNVEYKNNKTLVDIICSIHGHFLQRPDSHLRGIGCPLCGQIKSSNSQRKTIDIFITQSNKIHGFKYDYTKSDYTGAQNKLEIICLKHGAFYQTPNSHLKGNGCPLCVETYGERNIRIFLQENNIDFIYQKSFNNCKYKGLLKFDFYLPKFNLCLEYDGKQHSSPYYYFGGEKSLEIQKIKDKIKTDYCLNNNILLFRIDYKDNINNKLKELNIILKNNNEKI